MTVSVALDDGVGVVFMDGVRVFVMVRVTVGVLEKEGDGVGNATYSSFASKYAVVLAFGAA